MGNGNSSDGNCNVKCVYEPVSTLSQKITGSYWGVMTDFSWGNTGNVMIDGLSSNYQPIGQIRDLSEEKVGFMDVPLEQGSLKMSLNAARDVADKNEAIDAFEYDTKTGIAIFKSGVLNVCPSSIYNARDKGRYQIYFKMHRFGNGAFFRDECSGFTWQSAFDRSLQLSNGMHLTSSRPPL